MKSYPIVNVALLSTIVATAFAGLAGCVLPSAGVLGTVASATASPTPSVTSVPGRIALGAVTHLRNIRTGLELKHRQAYTGSLYYAIYDVDQGTLTPDAIKTAAMGALGGNLVENGTLAVTAANSDMYRNITSLADKKQYYLYSVGEDAVGLDIAANALKFSKILPKAMTQFNFTKGAGTSPGTLIRYAVSVPQDYYDNPTANYPILIWIHGNGESANDASNAEVNYTNLAGLMGPFKRINNDLSNVPMIVIGVQCNYAFFDCAHQNEYTIHKEAYDNVITKLRVNVKRVYVGGISYGGEGTFTFISHYPTLVAAAFTLSATSPVASATLCSSIGVNNVPLWAAISTNDAIFSHNSLQQTVLDLRACGSYTNALAKPKITVLSNGTYPNTVDGFHHGATENNILALPWNDGAWKYWNGAAEVADTIPPTHPSGLATEFTTATPGFTGGAPNIQSDSLASASTLHGATLSTMYDFLMLFAKP